MPALLFFMFRARTLLCDVLTCVLLLADEQFVLCAPTLDVPLEKMPMRIL